MFSTITKYLALAAAVLATASSVGIFVFILAQKHTEGNVVVSFILVLASAASIAAYYSARAKKTIAFLISYIIYGISIAPTMWSLGIFTYLPIFFLMTAVLILMFIRTISTLFSNKPSKEI